ncbi:hypothetical protein BV511_04065 [Methylorubrum extorquens]|nr:hypothetical protein BV511_04065 [Methylorubrum extorquens]ARO54546.1 hypothetical protein B2G69_10520 [Methylorubrum zatmanii]
MQITSESRSVARLRGSAGIEDNVRHQLATLHVTDCNEYAAASRVGFPFTGASCLRRITG